MGNFSLLLDGFSLARSVSVCILSGFLAGSILASVIFVRQYGQAVYGSAGPCKFKVLSGVVKTFLHDTFGQVYVNFPSFISIYASSFC